MAYLRFVDATADMEDRTLRFPGSRQPGRSVRTGEYSSQGVSEPPEPPTVHQAEEALDRVQARLNNLRELMQQFGLAGFDEDHPRAA